jgi:hypothetical protein
VITRGIEDALLTQIKRDRLTATARDQYRNNGVFNFLVKKHLDYITPFNIKFTSKDSDLNKQLEKWFYEYTNDKKTFDI